MKRIALHDINAMVEAAAEDIRKLLASGDIIVPQKEDYLAVADKHDLPMGLEPNEPTGKTLCIAAFAPEEVGEISAGCYEIWRLFQKLDELDRQAE